MPVRWRGSALSLPLPDSVCPANFDGRIGYQGRYNSEVKDHAFYGSLRFKFGGSVPPPPPPVVAPPPAEPAPATQTCYDGSVILATDTCPLPPPPPAPAPMPERG